MVQKLRHNLHKQNQKKKKKKTQILTFSGYMRNEEQLIIYTAVCDNIKQMFQS